jgi:D-glycero-alpha-D-manno-heptose-7-phosphate kinase
MANLKKTTFSNLVTSLKKSNIQVNAKIYENWSNEEWYELLNYHPANPICWGRNKDGTVVSENLEISTETLHNLEDNLLLFFTGISRSASHILMDQDKRSRANDEEITQNLHYIKKLGFQSRDCLLNGDMELFGLLMNEHWEHKRLRSSGMSNEYIDDIYTNALQNGAIGGKLVGAGGGGFLMFYANNKNKLREAMSKFNLEEVRFSFDYQGTKIILS